MAAVVVIVVVVVVVVIVLGNGDDESTTPAPSKVTAEKTAQEKSQEPQDERADLLSFKLDDRSEAGLTNIWVVWTIRNSSSEKSNYSWDWEAVDASGTRLANGSEVDTDVQPGQTALGEDFTTLKSVKGIKLNITSLDRTASY